MCFLSQLIPTGDVPAFALSGPVSCFHVNQVLSGDASFCQVLSGDIRYGQVLSGFWQVIIGAER